LATSETPTESAARRAGRRRIVLATGASAAGLTAVLAGAAFALQAVALPRPSPGQLTATGAVRWLTRHDAVESIRLVGRHPVSDLCVNVVVGPLHGLPRHHGSLLITPHGRLVETRFSAFRVGRRLRHADRPLAALQTVLAGCSRALERQIGLLLDVRASVQETKIVRRGAVLLQLGFGRGGGLTLLVRPRTFAPVAIRVALRSWTYLAPAERSDLATPLLRLPSKLRRLVTEDL
jgi:hypothetical protein